MKKNKRFDCVQMKWDIQRQMREEFKEVPEAEARKAQMRQVAKDPILGPLYKRMKAKRQSAGKK
jgi:hypothetical protein